MEATLKARLPGITQSELTEAVQMCARYTPAQVGEALDYTAQRAARPNWPYVRRVLTTKKRRLTMKDYHTFREDSCAKLDYYRGAVTGFEDPLPAEVPAYARAAIEGKEA